MDAKKQFQIPDIRKLKGLPRLFLCPVRFLLMLLAIGKYNVVNIEEDNDT
jgi:hypothetical protein